MTTRPVEPFDDALTPDDIGVEWMAKRTFRVEDLQEGDTAVVCPVGELDLSTVARVDERLESLVAGGARRLILDLRRLSFMDSTGLRLVIGWDDRARSSGIAFELVQGEPEIQRLFEITRLIDRLTFIETDDR